jgi:hypothetical protein
MVSKITEIQTNDGEITLGELIRFLLSTPEFKSVGSGFSAMPILTVKEHTHSFDSLMGIDDVVDKEQLKAALDEFDVVVSGALDSLEKRIDIPYLREQIKKVEDKQDFNAKKIGAKLKELESRKPESKTTVVQNYDKSRIDTIEKKQNEVVALLGKIIDDADLKVEDLRKEIAAEIAKKIQKDGKHVNIIGGVGGVNKLKLLFDVNVEGVTNGQTIVWNAATEKWIPSSGGGGGASWGGITGTLSDQTDLQAALDAKQTIITNAETNTLVAAFTVQPDLTRVLQIDRTISALKDAGIWQELDALWVMAAHDSQAGLINWINPTALNLTAFNSPTFTADAGYQGNGTDAYLTPSVNWNTLTKFQQDSLTMFGWVNAGTDAAATLPIFGHTGTANCRLFPRSVAGALVATLSSGSNSTFNASSTILGLSHANRSGASATQGYKDGAAWGTNTQASTTTTANQITLLRTATLYSDYRLSVAGVGASLTAQQASDLYDILGEYLNGIVVDISQVEGLQTALDGKLNTTALVGAAKITVGATAPVSPAVGDVWIDTSP